MAAWDEVKLEIQRQSTRLSDIAALHAETNKHLKRLLNLLEDAEHKKDPLKKQGARPQENICCIRHSSFGLDRPIAVVLLTAPSLRSELPNL